MIGATVSKAVGQLESRERAEVESLWKRNGREVLLQEKVNFFSKCLEVDGWKDSPTPGCSFAKEKQRATVGNWSTRYQPDEISEKGSSRLSNASSARTAVLFQPQASTGSPHVLKVFGRLSDLLFAYNSMRCLR